MVQMIGSVDADAVTLLEVVLLTFNVIQAAISSVTCAPTLVHQPWDCSFTAGRTGMVSVGAGAKKHVCAGRVGSLFPAGR
jgi:hypothetical protein